MEGQEADALAIEVGIHWNMLMQRVANTFKIWIDNHYIEAFDEPVLGRIEKFARDNLVNDGLLGLSVQVLQVIERRVSEMRGVADDKRSGDGEGPRRIAGSLFAPPAPIVPRVPSGRAIRLTDISPVELARQFTILESANFQRIKPDECLRKAWTKEVPEGAPNPAPNLKHSIQTDNKIAAWVGWEIVAQKDAKNRASIMKLWIATAIVSAA
jgi:son of sevenless-like protein